MFSYLEALPWSSSGHFASNWKHLWVYILPTPHKLVSFRWWLMGPAPWIFGFFVSGSRCNYMPEFLWSSEATFLRVGLKCHPQWLFSLFMTYFIMLLSISGLIEPFACKLSSWNFMEDNSYYKWSKEIDSKHRIQEPHHSLISWKKHSPSMTVSGMWDVLMW
jgi:hypothetical protein